MKEVLATYRGGTMGHLVKFAELTAILAISGSACGGSVDRAHLLPAASEDVVPEGSAPTEDESTSEALAAVGAANCERSTVCNPWASGVKMRNHPNRSGPVHFLNHGTGLYIVCWAKGEPVGGPWGRSDIWDYVDWTSEDGHAYKGFVSDTYVYTGSPGPMSGISECKPVPEGNIPGSFARLGQSTSLTGSGVLIHLM